MIPNTRPRTVRKPSGPKTSTIKRTAVWDDPTDSTMPSRGGPSRRHEEPSTAPIWIFTAAMGLSVVSIAVGAAAGWLLLLLTLATAYAWLPTRKTPPTVSVTPKPTTVPPGMQRWLTEGVRPWILGAAIFGIMILVGTLAGL